MRINVYSQELTSEVQLETKESNTGIVYSAVRLMLHSSPMLHHPGKTEVKCTRCDGEGWHMTGEGGGLETCEVCKGEKVVVLEQDDDRSGITFWLPKSHGRRLQLADAFEEMARQVRNAPSETGLD
jgi:hypothetical protein